MKRSIDRHPPRAEARQKGAILVRQRGTTKGLYGLLMAIAGLTLLLGCSAGGEASPEDATFEWNDRHTPQAPADLLQSTDEEPFDDELAAEIAESKLADRDGELEKHATCGQSGPNIQNKVVADAAINGAANQRSGSSTGCPALGALQPTDDARYFCFTHANDGFTWTYLENLRTQVRGWTRDDLLRDFGSSFNCGI